MTDVELDERVTALEEKGELNYRFMHIHLVILGIPTTDYVSWTWFCQLNYDNYQ